MSRRSPGIDALDAQPVTEQADRDQLVKMLAVTRGKLARSSVSQRERDAQLRGARAARWRHADPCEHRRRTWEFGERELHDTLIGSTTAGGADVPGTALVLALSRSLLQARGDRVSCDNVLGKGSTFGLELTAAQPGDRPLDTDTTTSGTALTDTTRTS